MNRTEHIIIYGVIPVTSAPADPWASVLTPKAPKAPTTRSPARCPTCGGIAVDKDARRKAIFAALGRGNGIQFRDRVTGVTKVVTTWNPRGDGELLASSSTGKSNYVDPYRATYDLTEVWAG